MNSSEIKKDIEDLKNQIAKWVQNHQLNGSYSFSLYSEHYSTPSSCVLLMFIDENVLSVLNGYLSDELKNSFDELIDKTKFWYEMETSYRVSFCYLDQEYDKYCLESSEWEWLCNLIEESYYELHEEIYTTFKENSKIQNLSPRQFEQLLDVIFKNQGYRTELGPGQNDGGIDLKLYHKDDIGDIITYVQAKRYAPKNPIRLEAVQALYGVVKAKNANKGIFVTSSRYLPGVRKFQKLISSELILKDNSDLIKWCNDAELKIIKEREKLLDIEYIRKELKSIKRDKNYNKIVYKTSNINCIMNTFYIILKETERFALLKKIESVYNTESEFHHRGLELPNFNYEVQQKSNQDFVRAKKTTMWNVGEILVTDDDVFYYWKGIPLNFDWND